MANKIADFMFQQAGFGRFEKFLDLTSFRHKLIAGNVANVSTPGYRSRDIDFRAEFARLTGEGNRLIGTVTHPAHIRTGDHEERPPKVNQAEIVEGDMNGADIDEEMSRMAQNELFFSIGARLLKRKIDGLQKAITSKG